MKHKVVSWVASLAVLLVTGTIFVVAILEQADIVLELEWRWFAVPVMISFMASVILQILILRSSARKGALYWFAAFNFGNIAWQFLVLLVTLSATPEAQNFWQHMVPLAWIPIPTMLLYFVLTYVDDTELPGSVYLFLTTFVGTFALVFLAGTTDLIEPTYPIDPVLKFWGYQGAPGDWISVVFVWAFVVSITSIIVLVKAYRRAINPSTKKQLGIFIFALIQYIVIAITTDVFIYSIKPDLLPPASILYNTTLTLIIGYGILRYGIFQINPVSLADKILHSLSEGVLGINADLKIEFINTGAEALVGTTQSSLKGKQLGELFSPEVYQKIENEIESGKRYIEFDDTEIRTVRGKSVPVTLSIGQVFDDRSRLAGYIVVVANISEIKKKSIELAQEKASVERKVIERTKELSETHARLTASINSLHLGFLMTNDKNEVLIINSMADELIRRFAKSQKMALSGDTLSMAQVEKVFKAGIELQDTIKRSWSDKKPYDFSEIRLAEHYVHTFIAPVVESGKPIGTVVLFEDITDEKALQRSKDEFFSIASHELRTPLTLIRGNTELIKNYYGKKITSTEVLGIINDIESSSTRLIQIVNDFLDVSSLEQGKIKLRPEEFVLNDLVKDVFDEMRGNLKDRPIELKITGATEPIKLNADKDRTKQVLINLIGNALKFTEKGSVTVELTTGRNKVRVAVADTGKGISIENQGLLFRKFQQAGKSLLSRDGEGTGLGLYITKLLVTTMGGTVGLESSEVGKGSTFFFTLPLQ